MSAKEETKDLKDTEKSNTKEEKETTVTTTEQDQSNSIWTPVWDSNANAYYYWNTETNETTWENPIISAAETSKNVQTGASNSETPLDFVLDRIDNVVKKELDNGEQKVDEQQQQQQQQYQEYYDQYYNHSDYSTQAHFNARTGRFTAQVEVDRLNPEHLSFAARATRQMNAYFDVEGYTEQRNAERAAGKVTKKKPLTRKEIEYFKRMKQEKKSKRAREWLLQ